MMKIVFVTIPMREHLEKLDYSFENGKLASTFSASFVATIALNNCLKKTDTVKVVMVKKQSENGYCDKHAETLQSEIKEINSKIGAKIDFISVDIPFIENRKAHEQLLEELIGKLEDGAQIVADITYSTKSMPLLMFSALNFGEKFFDCKIEKIVYGKVDFVNGKPTSPELCDVTSLYYINSITNTMEAGSSEDAKNMLSQIIKM